MVARAYIDQLERSNAISDVSKAELGEVLASADARLGEGARDARLARRLTSLAKSLADDGGNAIDSKRRVALAETLNGIAARLR